MMKQLRLDYPTSVLSRMLVVSASGYYAWVDRPPSKRAREEVRLELEIKAAHKRTRQTYGPERLQRDLAEHGVRVGIGRIKRIRKKLGIRCKQKRRFKATTQSRYRLSVAENVLGQQFKVYRPNAVWVTDITYVPTDEGWLYLAGHKDLLLDRVERAIGDLEAQNEAGEDTAAAHLPEELADKEVLRAQVRQAMTDLASQERHKRINLTDRDARLMKGRQGIVAGYNAQAMVSPTKPAGGGTGMLVTAVDVVDEANDNAMLAPMMERAEETTGTKAQTTLADAGYFAGSHLEECASRGQQVVVSESRRRFLKDPYHKDQFTYDEQSDSFTCPQGQTLHFVRIQHANGVPLRLYRASGAVCQACPAFGVCTRAREIGRSLAVGPHDAVLRRHRAWMATSAAKEAYRLRKQLVEPVFGIIKEQQMARRFLLRGLVNVATEWTMLATAFNLRTLWRAWRSRAFIQLPHGPNLHSAS